jgi:hypothetical protein
VPYTREGLVRSTLPYGLMECPPGCGSPHCGYNNQAREEGGWSAFVPQCLIAPQATQKHA